MPEKDDPRYQGLLDAIADKFITAFGGATVQRASSEADTKANQVQKLLKK